MGKLQGVADTLYIPLAARIYVSEHFPEYFYDEKALSLKGEMPYDEIAAKSSQYFQMAGACRFFNTDRMIRSFISLNGRCNIVNLGCGLETSYFRIQPDPDQVTFYEMDLPQVIESRRKVLGEGRNEILIGGDMFDFHWAEGIDPELPTMITVIGVFQYFKEEDVLRFLSGVRQRFPNAELVFDAMPYNALKKANDYIRKTGNTSAELHFGVDDGKAFAEKCGLRLIEQCPFFSEARKQLKWKLNLYTRIAMKVVDEAPKGFLLRFGMNN